VHDLAADCEYRRGHEFQTGISRFSHRRSLPVSVDHVLQTFGEDRAVGRKQADRSPKRHKLTGAGW
jgi:hypothetical protein